MLTRTCFASRRLAPTVLVHGVALVLLTAATSSTAAAGQGVAQSGPPGAVHAVRGATQNPVAADQAQGNTASPWSLSVDGVAFATFNRQGSRRGETEFVSQNWVMVMGMRPLARGMLTLSGGLSAEPLTIGAGGYSHIFQVGEAYQNLQVTDRQHPHDLLMQLAATWRVPIGNQVNFTVAGGLVGEPALGPVAFIHRASSFENPTAPLSHHIFDSTHIGHGVVTMGVDRGPLAFEASAFRGREPDEHRYDLDLGALDSWSTRLWIRPGPEWAIQGSYGHLHEPEALEPGDQRRTNGSVSWFRQRGAHFTAATAAVGRNARPFSKVRALLLELTQQWGRTSVFSRFESLTVETEILLFPQVVHRPHPGELIDPVKQLTVGAVRDVASIRGFQLGVGADVAFYGVPETLQFTHDRRPASYHVFMRVRPPAIGGRMWNMTMGAPMGGPTGHEGMNHGTR
jgi:hypothetical protein